MLPLGYGAFQGFRKGLLLEVVSLLALVLGIVGGLKLLAEAIPALRDFVGDAHGLLPFVAFLLVFAAIVLGVHLAGWFLKRILHLTPFGLFDNVLGALLGLLKWCLALSLLLYVAALAGLSISDETAQASQVYPVVLKATPYALEILGWVMPFVKTLAETVKSFF